MLTINGKKLCPACFAELQSDTVLCPYCGGDMSVTGREPQNALPQSTVLNSKYVVGRILRANNSGIEYVAYDCFNNSTAVITEYFPVGLAWRQAGEYVVVPDSDKANMYADGITAFRAKAAESKDTSDVFDENGTAYFVSARSEDGMRNAFAGIPHINEPEKDVKPAAPTVPEKTTAKDQPKKKKNGLVVLIAALAALVIIAAVGIALIALMSPKEPKSIYISDTAVSELTPGQTVTVVCVITPDKGFEIEWQSSDTTVATVGDNGVVTAVAPGSVTIIAKAGGKTAMTTFTVKRPLKAIGLSQEAVTLKKGDIHTLVASPDPYDAADVDMIWSSSDAGIVSVSADGIISANNSGKAIITVKSGNIAKSCVVTVAIEAKTVALSKSSLTLKKGERETLTVSYTPDDVTDPTVTWSSSNASVAAVSSDGTVSAVGAGTATVTAKIDNAESVCTVTVPLYVPVTAITLSEPERYMKQGSSASFTATVSPSNTTEKIAWSSSNPSVATVDANGKVTAVSAGEVTVTAASGTVSASQTFKVSQPVTGKTGTISWELYDNKYLIISGNGTVNANLWVKYDDMITDIEIGEGIEGIAQRVFDGYSKLTTIKLPQSLKRIETYAFCSCDMLSEITIPENVGYMGKNIFNDCPSLKRVNYNAVDCTPGWVQGNSVYSLFWDTKITEITIGDKVKIIPNGLFWGGTGAVQVKNIVIPDSVTTIEGYAFAECNTLESVTISKNVTVIENNAFMDCVNLKDVYIESPTIAKMLISFSVCGSLIEYADRVYVLGSISESSTGIAVRYYSKKSVSYNGKSYYMYTIEK